MAVTKQFVFALVTTATLIALAKLKLMATARLEREKKQKG